MNYKVPGLWEKVLYYRVLPVGLACVTGMSGGIQDLKRYQGTALLDLLGHSSSKNDKHKMSGQVPPRTCTVKSLDGILKLLFVPCEALTSVSILAHDSHS